MMVDNPARAQLMVAWRENKWIVSRNSQEVAAYAFKSAAMDGARRVAAEIAAADMHCSMLIRDRDGRWAERACPRPPRTPG